MSVLIPGMKMPESCSVCKLSATMEQDELVCKLLNCYASDADRETECPLIEIPPHGRLIDADELMKKIFGSSLGGLEWFELVLTKDKNELQTALFYLPIMFNSVPTIIPADKEE